MFHESDRSEISLYIYLEIYHPLQVLTCLRICCAGSVSCTDATHETCAAVGSSCRCYDSHPAT